MIDRYKSTLTLGLGVQNVAYHSDTYLQLPTTALLSLLYQLVVQTLPAACTVQLGAER